jgi:GntR family transcriptional repressor for pyruvate dehydrogenase complex
MEPGVRQGFRAVNKTRASEEVVQQIRELIAAGRIGPGDRFPSERDLCRILTIGRSTLREAIRALEALGLIRVVPGQGTFLVELPGTVGGEGPGADSRLKAWDRQREMFEVREVLEPGLAALAARRATEEHLARIRAALVAQEAEVKQGGPGMAPNTAFHAAVAEAADNSILLQMVRSFLDLLRESRQSAWQNPERPARSLEQHREILAAIESRNPRLAERIMREHVQGARRFVLLPSERQPLD